MAENCHAIHQPASYQTNQLRENVWNAVSCTVSATLSKHGKKRWFALIFPLFQGLHWQPAIASVVYKKAWLWATIGHADSPNTNIKRSMINNVRHYLVQSGKIQPSEYEPCLANDAASSRESTSLRSLTCAELHDMDRWMCLERLMRVWQDCATPVNLNAAYIALRGYPQYREY